MHVRLRQISYETMMMCFPTSNCTRQAWMQMRGKPHPIKNPLKTVAETCARGGVLYETGLVAPDNRAITLCGHVAEID